MAQAQIADAVVIIWELTAYQIKILFYPPSRRA
jgi:hypothetical protein